MLETFVEFFDCAIEKKTENLECITDQNGWQETDDLEELVNANHIDYELKVKEEIHVSSQSSKFNF